MTNSPFIKIIKKVMPAVVSISISKSLEEIEFILELPPKKNLFPFCLSEAKLQNAIPPSNKNIK